MSEAREEEAAAGAAAPLDTAPVRAPETRRGLFVLWAAVLAGPAAFLLNLQVIYMVVTLACRSAAPWLHLTVLATLAFAGTGTARCWRTWRATADGGSTAAGDAGSRTRFLAGLGLLAGPLFAAIIIAQWIPILILGPCEQV